MNKNKNNLNKSDNLITATKIDCHKIKLLCQSVKCQTHPMPHIYTSKKIQKFFLSNKEIIVKYVNPTMEVLEDKAILDKLLLDVRTYICANDKCMLHYKRSHRRLSSFNMNIINKLDKDSEYINIIKSFVRNLTNTWILKTVAKIPKTCTVTETENNDKTETTITKHKESQSLTQKCSLCHYPKVTGTKHIHFLKGSIDQDIKPSKNRIEEKYMPIETVFNEIDKMVENNNKKAKITEAPSKQIQQPNKIRMTYGDINYLGLNKAIFYFDRGIRGKQIFVNSMSPLNNLPKYKDRVVIDDIVFISECKCDSAKQHERMFPHYRVTCAVGLTCPARLNSFERRVYAIDKNASPGRLTTARAMLIRYW